MRSVLKQVLHRGIQKYARVCDFSLKSAQNLVITSNTTSSTHVTEGFAIIEDFINEQEHESLCMEVEKHLKKLRYEYDHWDNAIHGYREMEKQSWTIENQSILDRLRKLAFRAESEHLSHVHVLDLSEEGHIKPHVDSVRFCGSTIAGISLLSPCVFKLINTKDPSSFATCLVRPRSLYIMRDVIRYDYTHEVLANKDSYFEDVKVHKGRRISVICRSEPLSEHTK